MVEVKPVCQRCIEKGGSALLANHPFTGNRSQFRHDLAASSMLGQGLQSIDTGGKQVAV